MLTDDEMEALKAAITAHLLISVRYNGGASTLAPFATFTRHDETYLQAVTLVRDGRQPSRLKLGMFKLAGLSALQATPVAFSPAGLFRRVERARDRAAAPPSHPRNSIPDRSAQHWR